MGQPVVHFEVVGKDADKLQAYYGELFGWEMNADNPMKYGMIQREGNVNAEGVGIGGGIGGGMPDYDGHLTFYVEVPDVEEALQQAERLGGKRVMGPATPPGAQVEIGQFTDPEGHLIGVLRGS
jgi:predicted enzyme related to lactoylglutathione lyase